MKKLLLTLGAATVMSGMNVSATTTDLPNLPICLIRECHRVPDAGSALGLVGLASMGMVWVSRKIKRS